MAWFRGSQSESYANAHPKPFTLRGQSAITYAHGIMQRALVAPETPPAPLRETNPSRTSPALISIPSLAFTSSWVRGNQNEVLAANFPRPVVWSGFVPISVIPPFLRSPPVLQIFQDPNWALTGAGNIWYPAPTPLSYIPPQRMEVRPQEPISWDVPRSWTYTPSPVVTPPPPLEPRISALAELVKDPGFVFVRPGGTPSVVPVSAGAGLLTVRQEEPSLTRNLLASVTWTQPQVQPPASPANRFITYRQEVPPEFPFSFYTAGHVFLQGVQYVLLQDAIQSAVNLGFIVECQVVTWNYNNTVPYGYVISQSIQAGTSVSPNTVIYFTASLGPPQNAATTVVPSLVGLPMWQALAAVTQAQLVMQNNQFAYSALVPAGSVISQTITAGNTVLTGTQINLIFSLGPQPVPQMITVPDLTVQPLPFKPAND